MPRLHPLGIHDPLPIALNYRDAFMIGMRPPEGHPYWTRLKRAGITPLMAVDSPILREDPPEGTDG